MKATLIPDLLTPCSAREYIHAVQDGLETLMGKSPSFGHVAVLTAQSALESGRWKSMHRNNPGNIKASSTYEYLYCQFRCNELINGKLEWFDPPHPQTNFRAFLDLEVGTLDYLRFLSQRVRYASAWEAAKRGDPAAFVHALKIAGYFTASEGPYLKAVVSLFNEYVRLMASEPELPANVLCSDEDCAKAVLVVAPDPDRLLHTAAVQALVMSDPLEWSADERRAQMKEE
jgi:hypothetical protein